MLKEFLDERCVLASDAFTPRQAIYAAYVEWSKSVGDAQPLDRPGFYDQLRRVPGVTEGQKRVAGVPRRGWEGIAVGNLGDQYHDAQMWIGHDDE